MTNIPEDLDEFVEWARIKAIGNGYAKSDYPFTGKIVGKAKNSKGETILLMDNGTYAHPRHVCQRCEKLLIITDYFDYICNECERK